MSHTPHPSPSAGPRPEASQRTAYRLPIGVKLWAVMWGCATLWALIWRAGLLFVAGR